LSIIRSDTSALFGERLRELEKAGNRLINAFKPAFVSSMSFSVTWNKGNYGTNSSSTFLRASIESGGTTLNIFSPSIITDWGLQPYQYLRLNVDLRKTALINRNTLFAYRVNGGVGYAYSENKVMPYEKNFFVGGSNSVRAWRPRRLGPGSLAPALSSNPENNGRFDYRFEKPGDLLLEGSAELRQKLFGFVNYALFVDAGNVWSLQSNTNPAAKFKLGSFLKEFGVGTGIGLRFDFTFLILRLDAGIKVLDPGRPVGERFVLNKARFFKPFGTEREPVIFNIGIGYPF
ncbi:MAG: BamA/TamA family outer membrane protein, partial [Bacteroidota bacterium]